MRTECFTVAELLADPKAWTQKAEARDAAGHEVAWNSGAACSWCLLSALCRVYVDGDSDYAYRKALGVLELKLYGLFGWLGPVDEWQDAPERTYAEVHHLVLVAGI